MTASSNQTTAKAVADDRRQSTQDVGNRKVEETQDSNRQTSLKVQDPFLYYSNDRVRMKELLLEEEEEGNSSNDISVSAQEQSDLFCERKTRISFELHYSLLHEDLFDDDDNDALGDISIGIDDLLDAFLRDDTIKMKSSPNES